MRFPTLHALGMRSSMRSNTTDVFAAKGYVYAVMPVGTDYLYEKKRGIVASEAQLVGMEVMFPMEFSTVYSDKSEAILTRIRKADLLIVDLSQVRPSCYFEVGLAQGLGRPCILIAEAGTDIHQVFGRETLKFYDGIDGYGEALRSSLSKHFAQR